jgi:phytanoyl-CoA hydroxylase
MITQANVQEYKRKGYVVVRQLFTPEEVAHYREHYMEMRRAGSYPGDLQGVNNPTNDPLKQFPRMINMHHWDDISLRFLIDQRINECLTALLGREPYAAQTMLYFKPAGARGQALHQDQYYLRVQPGTCMAAWLALDPCDEVNGCLQAVPGSHTWPLLCTEEADTTKSFTNTTVPLPEGTESDPVIMDAGDVMFFNGSLVHGSFPNITTDRFRRSLIGHYVEGNAEQVSTYYSDALRMDGTPIHIEGGSLGGACGVWVEKDGTPVIEVSNKRNSEVTLADIQKQ